MVGTHGLASLVASTRIHDGLPNEYLFHISTILVHMLLHTLLIPLSHLIECVWQALEGLAERVQGLRGDERYMSKAIESQK